METIDMKIYEPVPGKKGLVREVGLRKAKDVFHELEERLRQLGLYPDEYFVLNSPYDDKGALFPEIVTMNCYANWGGSEGIYLEVDLIAVEDGKLVRRNFATGKSLAEDGDSFDRLPWPGQCSGSGHRTCSGDCLVFGAGQSYGLASQLGGAVLPFQE